MSLYKQSMSVEQWYGTSVNVPNIDSAKFLPFATSCIGIATKMLERETARNLRVGLSGQIDTAYADPDKGLVVISRYFLNGDFSAIGHMKRLNAERTIGAILGIITHEIAHFAYSPKDLSGYVEYIRMHTAKPFHAKLAKRVSNTIEDIYIEYAVSQDIPNLAWTLVDINKLMLTNDNYKASVTGMKTLVSIDSPEQTNNVLNYCLYAKVTSESGKVSPLAKKLFAMARSAIRMETLAQRLALALAIYDLVMPDQTNQNQNAQNAQNAPQNDSSESDGESTESEESGESGESGESESESESDSESGESDNSESDNDGSSESDNSESDSESGESDGESENAESGESDSESDSESGNGESGESGESEFDQETDDLFSGKKSTLGSGGFGNMESMPNTPIFTEIEKSSVTESSGIDNQTIRVHSIPLGSNPIEMDKRYTKLSTVARQNASIAKPTGSQQHSGRNLRQIHRIVSDQRIFANPLPTNSYAPAEIIILVDCSASMTHNPADEQGNEISQTPKIQTAFSATLGAAVGLLNGKCTVQVFGHSADKGREENTVDIFPFLRVGEPTSVLAKRLDYVINHPWKYCGYNRDSYALLEMAKRFTRKDRKRIILVISDGAPNSASWTYTGDAAIRHTQQTVDTIRKSGISVYSLSIDTQAFQTNNRIYGESFNVCDTDANAIDTMIRQIFFNR